jgi:opacity protein-like surface antigen
MKKICALTLCLLVFALPAQAFQDKKWEFTLAPGLAIPILGTENDDSKTTFNLQASLGYNFSKWATGGLEVGHDFSHTLEGNTANYPEDFDGDLINDNLSFNSDVRAHGTQIAPFLKLGKWYKFPSVDLRPYGFLGLGLYHFYSAAGSLRFTGTGSSGEAVDEQFTQAVDANFYLGYNAGIGMETRFHEKMALGLDLRYHRVITPLNDAEIFVPTLRMMYLF